MSQFLTYCENLPLNSNLSFKLLFKKIAQLFLIHGARRKDSLLKIVIANVLLENENIILLPNKTLKNSAPQWPFVYHKYTDNEKLCLVNCLRFYILERGMKMENTKYRLITTLGKLHHHVSRDTLSRWVIEELKLIGTNVNTFTTNSCRATSASKATSRHFVK